MNKVLARGLDALKRLLSIYREAARLGPSPKVEGTENSLGRARYVRAARTTLSSGINTILTIVVGILSIGLTVRYLGTERYGLWLTISTILAWLNLSGFGVGNALTNRLSAALGRGREGEIPSSVSAAFWILALAGFLIMLAGVVLGYSLPWAEFLNAKSADAVRELPLAITLSFIIYGLGFPLSITRSIYSGYQEGYFANYWEIAANIAALLGLLAVVLTKGGLPSLVVAVYGARLLVLVSSGIFLFKIHRPALVPRFASVQRKEIRPLVSVGGMFVALQLTGLLITQTDNLIIARMLGLDSVATYGTLWKMFNYVNILQSLILMPLWPAFGEAYARGEVKWIYRTLKYSLLGLMGGTLLISSLLTIFGRQIIKIWTGADLATSFPLIVGMALFQIILAWTQPFVFFLNGIGRLRGPLVYGLGTGLLSLGLKIIFAPRWGLEGIIGATLLSYMLLSVWLLPIDSIKGLRSIRIKARGTSIDEISAVSR
jgi:O-antigen/teichoic acid export membrane protein